MNTAQTALVILASLVGLSMVGAAIYAYAKGSSQDIRIARLQSERDDLLSRLNYVEPRFEAVKEQNEVLRTLIDPSPKLKQIGDSLDAAASEIMTSVERAERNTDAIKGVLLSQARTLDEIRKRVHIEEPE